jgi:hypothetical protein
MRFGLKILEFFDADLDPGSKIFLTQDPGSGKIRIRDKHPRSATLLKALIKCKDRDPFLVLQRT